MSDGTVTMSARVILPAYRQIVDDVVLLRVPCMRCKKFHTHGNGEVGSEINEPGDRTHRVGHCPAPSDYYLQIERERYNKRWSTKSGRISKSYIKHLGLAA